MRGKHSVAVQDQRSHPCRDAVRSGATGALELPSLGERQQRSGCPRDHEEGRRPAWRQRVLSPHVQAWLLLSFLFHVTILHHLAPHSSMHWTSYKVQIMIIEAAVFSHVNPADSSRHIFMHSPHATGLHIGVQVSQRLLPPSSIAAAL